MLDPIFSRSHRIPGRKDIPRTPTNTERMQAYRAIAPVEFWNTRFNPHRQDEAAAARGALADGNFSSYGGGGVECGHAKAGKSGSIEFGGQRLATAVKGSESSLYGPKSQMPEVRLLPRAAVLDSPVNRSECRSSALPASTQSPLKDEQPRRAASPIPGTYTHTPGA